VDRALGDRREDVRGLTRPESLSEVLALKPSGDLLEQVRTDDGLELRVDQRGENQRRRALYWTYRAIGTALFALIAPSACAQHAASLPRSSTARRAASPAPIPAIASSAVETVVRSRRTRRSIRSSAGGRREQIQMPRKLVAAWRCSSTRS
jgi:hypothetical protein